MGKYTFFFFSKFSPLCYNENHRTYRFFKALEVAMFPWFSFLSYALITAGTPGPNNIMSMTNAANHGL